MIIKFGCLIDCQIICSQLMQKIVKIAVCGGGISSLSFVHGLQLSMKQKFPESQLKFKTIVFQKNQILGGRIYSPFKMIQDCFNQFDVGANLIDFDDQHSKQYLKSKLGLGIFNKLNLFKKDLLIYQNQKLRKGDYQKQRYFYQNGFQQLLNDLLQQIKGQDLEIKANCEIIQSKKLQNSWCICYSETNQKSQVQQKKQNFDVLVLSHTNNTQYVCYTKQIAVVYRFHPNKQLQFSSILFKNHPITFLCSHQEKYPNNSDLVGVFQTNIAFSQQNFNESDQTIAKKLYQKIPAILKQDLGIDEQNYFVYKWQKALIQSISKQADQKHFQSLKKSIKEQITSKAYIIGDAVYKKSRVTNAMKSGYEAAERLIEKTISAANL